MGNLVFKNIKIDKIKNVFYKMLQIFYFLGRSSFLENKIGLNKTSLSEDVYSIIKDRIQTGQSMPGSRILLREFADEIGVSITPVQYALGRLEVEGLVKSIPRKGFVVVELTAEDISELLDVRIMMETYAARSVLKNPPSEVFKTKLNELFVLMVSHGRSDDHSDYEKFLKADAEFHRIFVTASNNSKLVDLYDNVCIQMQAIRIFFLKSIRTRRVPQTIQEHQMILNGVFDWNVNQVIKGITRHLKISRKALTEEAMADTSQHFTNPAMII
jgi:DNA-binding GntR family transcriptional regulator